MERLDANLQAAVGRIEQVLLQALGANHPAIDDWAQIRFALRSAEAGQGGDAAPGGPSERDGGLAPHFKTGVDVDGALAKGDDAEGGLQVSYGLKWCDQCGEGTVQGLCRKRLPDCKFATRESFSISEANAQLVESFQSNGKLQLAAGEMTAQELRSVKAVLTMLAAQIRRGDATARREDQCQQLLETGKAVVARWDSPRWKDVGHTGEFIASLREAIAAIDPDWKGLGVLSSANPKPIWVVMDHEGYPQGSSSWPQLCHRYIEAAARDGVDVQTWVVRRFVPALPVRGPRSGDPKEAQAW